MRRILYSLIISFSLVGCGNEGDPTTINSQCFVNGSIENLEWLKEKIENFEKLMNSVRIDIHQYMYNNEPVFLINDCVDCADAISVVYNCAGDIICEFGGIEGKNTCPDFNDKATDKKLIWRNYNEVIINKDIYDNTTTDNYEIIGAAIKDHILSIIISSNGCSGTTWGVNLIDAGEILESTPPQRVLKIQLINKEACNAIVEKEIQYDISELKESKFNTLVLNLSGWNKTITYNY